VVYYSTCCPLYFSCPVGQGPATAWPHPGGDNSPLQDGGREGAPPTHAHTHTLTHAPQHTHAHMRTHTTDVFVPSDPGGTWESWCPHTATPWGNGRAATASRNPKGVPLAGAHQKGPGRGGKGGEEAVTATSSSDSGRFFQIDVSILRCSPWSSLPNCEVTGFCPVQIGSVEVEILNSE